MLRGSCGNVHLCFVGSLGGSHGLVLLVIVTSCPGGIGAVSPLEGQGF